MPLYEYQCQECGETHEVIRNLSEPAYTICPACGGPLKKLISSPAIQFKGSGFHITDYGKGNSGGRSAAPAKTSESGSSESRPASGSESKPASGSESKPASGSESKPASGSKE